MPEPVRGDQKYLPGLDGLRAIAVAAVVAYHLGYGWAQGGLLGVGVFFTLSGYLITDILVGQWTASGRIGLREFWMRRARRLLPALLVMLAVVTVWVNVFARTALTGFRGDVVAALLYGSNWWYIGQHASYYAQFAPPGPLDHLWSLAVEEQFYLVWPWAVLVGVWLLGRRYLKRPWLGRAGLAVLTLALAAASAALMAKLYQPGYDPTRVYEGTDTRACGLLVGAALALVLPSRRVRLKSRSGEGGRGANGSPVAARWLLDVAGIAGLATIGWLVWRTNQYSAFMFRGGLGVLSVATALVVAAVVTPGSVLGRALGWRPLRWIGVRSYGIYLWHYPVLVLTAAGGAAAAGGAVSPTRALVVAGATVGIAGVSWHFVEEPIRRGRRRVQLGEASGAGQVAGAGDVAGAGQVAGAHDVVRARQTVGAGDVAGAGQVVGAGPAAGAGQVVGAGRATGASQVTGAGQATRGGKAAGAGRAPGRHALPRPVLLASRPGIIAGCLVGSAVMGVGLGFLIARPAPQQSALQLNAAAEGAAGPGTAGVGTAGLGAAGHGTAGLTLPGQGTAEGAAGQSSGAGSAVWLDTPAAGHRQAAGASASPLAPPARLQPADRGVPAGAPPGTTSPAAGPPRTSCRSVVHIGDSTSDGLISSDYLPDPANRITARYAGVGVHQVITRVVGGTSIAETLPGTQNAYTMASELVRSGYRGCWVLALGTNDTADVYAGSNVTRAQRIARMMSLLRGQPVMWVEVISLLSSGPYAEQNMRLWNQALEQAVPKYPTMRIYDWPSAAKPSWFISDGIHYTSNGYMHRAFLIADALAAAFPAQ